MSSVSATHAEQNGAGRPKLKRSLGLWMATALVIGNMVGSGVFGLPASLASTGPISLLSWIFTGAGAILLALVFANLGRAYPETGGPYAYARRAFGDFAGFWTAWGYWIAAWAGNAAIATIFVSYASVFWPSLGTDNVLAFTLGLSVIWVLTLANCAGARESGIIQLVTTVLKFVPLLLIGLIGLFYMHSANFTPFDPNHVTLVGHWHAISFAATLTTLVPYAFAAAGQLMLMFTDREKFSGRRLGLDAAIAMAAFAYSFWMIYGAGQEYIAQGFLLLMAGVPVYVFMRWRQSKAAVPDYVPESTLPPVRMFKEERPLAPLGH